MIGFELQKRNAYLKKQLYFSSRIFYLEVAKVMRKVAYHTLTMQPRLPASPRLGLSLPSDTEQFAACPHLLNTHKNITMNWLN